MWTLRDRKTSSTAAAVHAAVNVSFSVLVAFSLLAVYSQTGRTQEFCEQPVFRRGDANVDGRLDLADPIFTLDWLFRGGAGPECEDSMDANDDGGGDISDVIYSLAFQFLGGPGPQAPGPDDCGPDPTPDPMTCDSYPDCAQPTFPDLLVESIDVDPHRAPSPQDVAVIELGTAVTVTVTVSNQSTCVAQDSSLEVFAAEQTLHETTVSPGSGASEIISFDVVFEADLLGPFELVARLTPADETVDANPANNVGAVGVFLFNEEAPPDVPASGLIYGSGQYVYAPTLSVATSLNLDGSTVLVGGSLTVSGFVDIRNSEVHVGGATTLNAGAEVVAHTDGDPEDLGSWISYNGLTVGAGGSATFEVRGQSATVRGSLDVTNGMFVLSGGQLDIGLGVSVPSLGKLTLTNADVNPLDGPPGSERQPYPFHVAGGLLELTNVRVEGLDAGGLDIDGLQTSELRFVTVAGSEGVGVSLSGNAHVVMTDCRITGTNGAALSVEGDDTVTAELHSTVLSPLPPYEAIEVTGGVGALVTRDWRLDGVLLREDGDVVENGCIRTTSWDGSVQVTASAEAGGAFHFEEPIIAWKYQNGTTTDFNPYLVEVFEAPCSETNLLNSLDLVIDRDLLTDGGLFDPIFRDNGGSGTAEADMTVTPDAGNPLAVVVDLGTFADTEYVKRRYVGTTTVDVDFPVTWAYTEGGNFTVGEATEHWKFALTEADEGEPGGTPPNPAQNCGGVPSCVINADSDGCGLDANDDQDTGEVVISLEGPNDNGTPVVGFESHSVDGYGRWAAGACEIPVLGTIDVLGDSESDRTIMTIEFYDYLTEIELSGTLLATPGRSDAGNIQTEPSYDVRAATEVTIIVKYKYRENNSPRDNDWTFHIEGLEWSETIDCTETLCDDGDPNGKVKKKIDDKFDWGANQSGSGTLKLKVTTPSTGACVYDGSTDGTVYASLKVELYAKSKGGDSDRDTLCIPFVVHASS